MDKIPVFLTDWQVLFREGIHFTLSGEDDFDVIGEATSNEEALTLIEDNPPRVAIFNADNKGKLSGTDITRRIKQNLPSVAVILVMDNYDEELIFTIMKSGASAYLDKDINPEELVNIIRNVAQNGHPISQALLIPEIASHVIEQFKAFSSINEEVDNLLARLMPIETEILQRIAGGSLLADITKSLDLDEEAVKRHLDFILVKLVNNDHHREVIEASQSSLNSIVSKISKIRQGETETTEYITKEEFSVFKENLKERFSSFMGELR
jgi:DNA-binding NarL/FixJ family response regulator